VVAYAGYAGGGFRHAVTARIRLRTRDDWSRRFVGPDVAAEGGGALFSVAVTAEVGCPVCA
jgi:hypothetical protein